MPSYINNNNNILLFQTAQPHNSLPHRTAMIGL